MNVPELDDTDRFIARWAGSGASERANYQLFLTELCDLLGVPTPEPARSDDRQNAYVFERNVPLHHDDGKTTTGRIDLYKRGCFILEAKQGSAPAVESPLFGSIVATKGKAGTARRGTSRWDNAMQRAKNQAERYARELPAQEGRPPFLVIVDVGHSFELYSEFSRSGGSYVPFPDPQSHRIFLADLYEPANRERLRQVWLEPLALDPSLRAARVTREIAGQLGELAKSLESQGHHPNEVAGFLMRVLFTMFAEDTGLIPKRSFKGLLESIRGNAAHFKEHVEPLWQVMNTGGYSRDLKRELLRFNGNLFADPRALPIDEAQLELLIQSATADWREVEPAIFGTLLERALNPRERHKLGAHYTPRAYVERLVQPTLIEPLRAEWQGVQAAVTQHRLRGKDKDAASELRKFHQRLCRVRVLDPACGSGNFLYVALELLKRLEGEVLEALEAITGEEQGRLEMQGVTVSPEQFLGLEVNPRAAKIAELVLWLGYLQWHFRTRGNTLPPEPVIRDFKNIECRDAVLAYDGTEVVLGKDGEPITHWDGRTTKTHSITGKEVPDESARTPELRYLNPREPSWPEADFIVGNPPFIGTSMMRQALGRGYTTTLRATYPDVPESSDFVMYWWHKAAKLLRAGGVQRFGFITTNSLRQTFNRRVLEAHMSAKEPVSLVYAVPDHPWVDASDGAAVRISMTVAARGEQQGVLQRVVTEGKSEGDGYEVTLESAKGKVLANLTIGAAVNLALPLKANSSLSNRGVQLFGTGFIVTPEKARELGLGRVEGLEQYIREYRNGRDLTQTPRGVMVVDLFGLTSQEVRERYPAVYQYVLEHVKPERDTNNRDSRRKNWWLFGETNPKLRHQLAGLERFIATIETSKHRFFVFLDKSILPDNKLVNIALDDAYHLGVLSSRVHVAWSLAAGGWLGVGNDPVYVKTRCFEAFPFPDASPGQRATIRELGESLDKHRKDRLAEHPTLTMTGMYNVLEKLRAGEPLEIKERTIHDRGLVSILKEIHDDLDHAVLAAYGWPHNLDDEAVLERLVALNTERAQEEARGKVRWLRPEHQNPTGAAVQGGMALEVDRVLEAKVGKQSWPKTLPEQASAVREALGNINRPVEPADITKVFKGARQDRVNEILATLATLGQLVVLEDGRYAR